MNCIYLCFRCLCVGIGWGAGTAMAHRAVDAVLGPRVIKHETVASSEPAAAASAPAPNTNSMNMDACGVQSKVLSDVCIFLPLYSSSTSFHIEGCS